MPVRKVTRAVRLMFKLVESMISLAFLGGAGMVFIGSSLFEADHDHIRAQFGKDVETLLNQIVGVGVLMILSGILAVWLRWMMGVEFRRWDNQTHVREVYSFLTAWRASTGFVILFAGSGIGVALWIGVPIVLRIISGR